MNMLASTDGVTFTADENIPNRWLVPLDGDTRTITQEGPQTFIAHIGCRFKCWSFAGALRACVEDMEYQRSRTVTLPVPLSEAERWLLDYSDADNASERRARP